MPPLAPRPGRQRVVRCYKLGLPLPAGYAGALRAGNMPWYKAQRHRPAVTPGRLRQITACARRESAAYWRRTPVEVW